MSNKNPQHINDLLVKIGLVKNGKVLATLRDYGQQGTHYDLVLHTGPESAANLVEKKLGIEANHYDDDGSYYWDFTIEDEWAFCFEQYRSGSEYMTITDLRPVVEEKPPVVSIVDISNSYQALKAEFETKKSALALEFKNNFESQMVQLVKEMTSIKAVTWVQHLNSEYGNDPDLSIYQPYFLSFVPEKLSQYYNNSHFKHENDFIIESSKVANSALINEKERKICMQIFDIIVENNELLELIFEDQLSLCLTSTGLNTKIYKHSE